MSQSLSQLLVHIVFSTKNRENTIGDAVSHPLHAYIVGSSRALGCIPIRIGGTANHVHLACRMSRTTTVSGLVEGIKSSSSRWMKHAVGGTRGFAWQGGYGAFSVSASRAAPLVRYIDGQREHHRTRSFEEEFLDLLRRNGIEYDERYLWT